MFESLSDAAAKIKAEKADSEVARQFRIHALQTELDGMSPCMMYNVSISLQPRTYCSEHEHFKKVLAFLVEILPTESSACGF